MISQFRPKDLSLWLAQASQHGTPIVLDVREPAELQLVSVKAEDRKSTRLNSSH